MLITTTSNYVNLITLKRRQNNLLNSNMSTTIIFNDLVNNILARHNEWITIDDYVVEQLKQNNDILITVVLVQYYNTSHLDPRIKYYIRKYVTGKMMYGFAKPSMVEYIRCNHQNVEDEDLEIFAIVCENILCNTIKELIQFTENETVTRTDYYKMRRYISPMSTFIERIYDF